MRTENPDTFFEGKMSAKPSTLLERGGGGGGSIRIQVVSVQFFRSSEQGDTHRCKATSDRMMPHPEVLDATSGVGCPLELPVEEIKWYVTS